MPCEDGADFVRDHLPLHTPRVVTPDYGGELFIRFLGQYGGMLVHHNPRGGIPCMGESCDRATHRIEPNWKAYAPALQWVHDDRVWRNVVLEITSNLSESLAGRRLRGELWSIKRVGKSKRKTKVVGRYLETVPEQQLLLPFDVMPVLRRVFAPHPVPSLDTINPAPPRILLPDVVASPPPGCEAQEKPRPPSPEEAAELRRKYQEMRAKLGRPPVAQQ